MRFVRVQFASDARKMLTVVIQYKQIYRLKEIKRASIMLGLQKSKRPVSVASVR